MKYGALLLAIVLVGPACGGGSTAQTADVAASAAATQGQPSETQEPATNDAEAPEVTSSDNAQVPGFMTIDVGDMTYEVASLRSCSVGQTEGALTVNFEVDGFGTTSDGKPFFASIADVELDIDGDGVAERQLKLSIEEGKTDVTLFPDSTNFLLSAIVEVSETSTAGELEMRVADRALNGAGHVSDVRGILADPTAKLPTTFYAECP